jgi:hypothetical protein
MSFVINAIKSVGGMIIQPFHLAHGKLCKDGWLGIGAMKEQLAVEITEMNIPVDSFLFKADELYELKVYCQICGQCRFLPEDVKVLSDPDLNLDAFTAKYPDQQWEIKGCCHNKVCQDKLFLFTCGFDSYHLIRAFPFQEQWQYLKRNHETKLEKAKLIAQ